MSTEISLKVYDESIAMVADLVKKDSVQELDHTTPEGEEALRSWVYRVKRGKGDIEKARKDAKSGILDMGRKIDAKAKELTEPLQEIIDRRMKPLNEIAAKAAAKKQAFLDAEEAKRKEKEEADARELAELRAAKEESERKEREAKIAKDAAEAAIKKAEQDKKDAAARAKKAKERAVAKAKAMAQDMIDKAAADAKAIEDKRIAEEKAEKIETARLAQIEADRIADEEHRGKIEGEIFRALEKELGSGEYAQTVLLALVEETIPHVKIQY
jgi:membrane protein involved in colicin uptake